MILDTIRLIHISTQKTLISQLLKLNVKLYVPKQTSAHRDVVMGIPDINDPLDIKILRRQVKLRTFYKSNARTSTRCMVYELEDKDKLSIEILLDILSLEQRWSIKSKSILLLQ